MNAPRIEWLQKRQSGIGGSDVAGILGISPWKTPLDVYLSKVEPVADKEKSEAAYWGIVLEDVVAQEFAKRKGVKVQRVNTMLAKPDETWMLANLDRAIVTPGSRVRIDSQGGIVGADGLLECKTASAYSSSDWGREGDEDEIPIQYAAQGMWYLAVTGLPWIDFACLIGGQRFITKRMERHEPTIREIQEQCRAFWFDHVLKRNPPPPVNSADMEKLFGRDNGELVEATGDVLAAVNDARALSEEAKALDAKLDAAKERIKMAIGPASGLAMDGKPLVTWKAPKASKVTDWEAVAQELAPLYDMARAHQATGAADIIEKHTGDKQNARRLYFPKSK